MSAIGGSNSVLARTNQHGRIVSVLNERPTVDLFLKDWLFRQATRPTVILHPDFLQLVPWWPMQITASGIFPGLPKSTLEPAGEIRWNTSQPILWV
jgi:hypothetical protein